MMAITRRPGAARPGLSRERIVVAALALVGEHGLPGLTVRRLGEALGCQAMSIYHYFPSKRALQDALVERAVAGIREPEPDLDPIARLRFIGLEYRAMAHRYPKLLPLLALHRLHMPAGRILIARTLRHFRTALSDDRLAAQAFRIFGCYVLGAVLDETLNDAVGPSTAEPAGEEIPGSTYELGLEIVLNGIAGLATMAPERVRPSAKPVVRPKH